MKMSTDRGPAEELPVVVLGAGGMLATALVDVLRDQGRNWVGLGVGDLDITMREHVNTVIQDLGPGIIINTASYTDVDGAESEAQLAFEINSVGAANVADAASQVNAAIVHISTDYVFNGSKDSPYLPNDDTNPINIYGASKLSGENLVREKTRQHMIIRTSWLFGPNGKNFVSTMLALGRTRSTLDVVDDQTGSPTYTRHLAGAVLDLMDRGVMGTYHLTNTEQCTWCIFAREIFRQSGMDVEVNPVPTEAFPRPAPRPLNSALDCSSAYELLGRPLPSWQTALNQYLEEIGEKAVAQLS
jgi:dTDP-4-dehydrorhamnose reductase